MLCNNCPRHCNISRKAQSAGFCRMPQTPVVAKVMLHPWEEPCISGKNGSGAIFFAGCSLRCVYCQNFDISHNKKGESCTPADLAEIFKKLEALGAHNINLVTATHFIDSVIEALNIYRPQIPIIYNSSGYETEETINKLAGYIDIYLLDLKYITPERAKRYSGAQDYPEYAKKAILAAKKQIPDNIFDVDGMLQKGVIIRHLILPQGTNEAIGILHWVEENVCHAIFSLMRQYTPCNDLSSFPELDRKITRREYEKVLCAAQECKIDTIYVQDGSSANKKYIPDF